MNQFNFKSQICTTREQSERLIALGLKKEIADMSYTAIIVNHKVDYRLDCSTPKSIDIPAWSLHRLVEIVAQTKYPYRVISKELPIYDALCERIEWLIKEGYFNKEYLDEKV